jgi:UDP-glucuronate decarboxylase
MIDGLVRMMEGPDEFIGPVNLGNPVEHTMLELAELVIRLTKSSSGLEFLPPPLDDPQRRRPDIALARQKLGWEPSTGIEDGLTRTIHYFRELLS